MDTFDITIRMLIEDFRQTILPSVANTLVRRDLCLGTTPQPNVGNIAKVIVGMRRSGKTFRLYQEILDLIDSSVDPASICYINYDDDRLRPYPDDIISRTLEVFYEINPQARIDGAYIFLDEIQDIPNWSITVRRIIDTEKVVLYLTGSSSRLLSQDVATEFRGRSLAYELLPYSFREYIKAHNLESTLEQDSYNKETATQLKATFKKYLTEGGFPAAQNVDAAERTQLLQSYTQLTVARDVVERNGFSNARYAQSLSLAAISSSARELSISRLDNKGRSSGYTPGRAKIAEILNAFEDAHLIYQVYNFGYSAQKIRLGGLKVYAADPGLYWASIPATNDGYAFSLETAVYLELRRRRQTERLGDIAMLKLPSKKEIDFVEGDATSQNVTNLIQVSYAMNNITTREREIGALQEGMTQFGQKSSTIITFDEEAVEETPDGIVYIIPAWKWFLSS